jgi:hypothetical protein
MQQFHCNNGLQARKHLEGILYHDKQDYIFETDKRRSPHTLIITKTRANPQFTREHTAWQSRWRAAQADMKKIGFEPLRKLLGDQYDATVNLKWLRFEARNPPSGLSNQMAQAPADDIEVIAIE